MMVHLQCHILGIFFWFFGMQTMHECMTGKGMGECKREREGERMCKRRERTENKHKKKEIAKENRADGEQDKG